MSREDWYRELLKVNASLALAHRMPNGEWSIVVTTVVTLANGARLNVIGSSLNNDPHVAEEEALGDLRAQLALHYAGETRGW